MRPRSIPLSLLVIFALCRGAAAIDGGIVDTWQLIDKAAMGNPSWSQFGYDVAALGDLDSNGADDFAIGSLYSVWIVLRNTNGSVLSKVEIKNNTIPALSGANLSRGLTGLGDFDGDGNYELAAGQWNGAAPGAPSSSGRLWIIDLDPTTGFPQSAYSIGPGSPNFISLGEAGYQDNFGYGIANVGDWDGDGNPELAVGAIHDDDGVTDNGAAYILFMKPANEPPLVAAGSNAAVLTEASEASLDLTGSVSDDLVHPLTITWSQLSGTGTATFGDASSPTSNVSFDTAGTYELELRADDTEYSLADTVSIEVYDVTLGAPPLADPPGDPVPPPPYNATGIRTYTKISATQGGFDGILDANASDFGTDITAIGDLNGDGQTDIAVGAGREDVSGSVFVLFMDPACGDALPAFGIPVAVPYTNCAVLPGTAEIHEGTLGFSGDIDNNGTFGQALAWLPDQSGFRADLLAVGAPVDNSYTGSVWLLALNPDGSVSGAQRISDLDGWDVDLDTDKLGHGLAPAGDFNGDGVSDFITGATSTDTNGSAYLIALKACSSITTNPMVFVAEDDDGFDRCVPQQLETLGVQTLSLYLRAGPRASTVPGDACQLDTADGQEMCAWDVRIEADPGITFTGFSATVPSGSPPNGDPVTGPPAGLDWRIVSDSEFRANWVGPLTPSNPAGGAIKIGDLQADIGVGVNGGAAAVRIAAGSIAVGAGLQLQSMPTGPIAVPEPGRNWMLACGAALLALLARRRRDRTGRAGIAALLLPLLLVVPWDASAHDVVSDQMLYSDGDAAIGSDPGDFQSNEHIFDSIAPLGDLDGDGTIDLVAGGSLYSLTGNEPGGRIRTLFLDEQLQVFGSRVIYGPLGNDGFGEAVAVIGDCDGGGAAVQCVAVGAPENHVSVGTEGSVSIIGLDDNGRETSRHRIESGGGGFPPSLLDSLDAFGRSLAFLGDLDGVGGSEMAIAVGAPGDDDVASDGGAIWILFLDGNEQVTAQVKIGPGGAGGFPGTLDPGDAFGTALVPLGDLDGNGVVDLAVGAVGDDDDGDGFPSPDKGAVWILYLQTAGANDVSVASAHKLSDTMGGIPLVLTGNGWFGWSLGWQADTTGEGGGILLVGAQLAQATPEYTNHGGVYVLDVPPDFPTTGTVRSGYRIRKGSGGDGGHGVTGFVTCCSQKFGTAVTALPDMNGDEVPDFMVTDPAVADGTGAGRGRGYLLYMLDSDFDGLDDGLDNCPTVHNPTQADTDDDGVGDVCDNCEFAANNDQADFDTDGEGDVCEPVEVQLITTGTPAAPSWDVKLQCGAFDVTKVNGAIVLPAGATGDTSCSGPPYPPGCLTLAAGSMGSGYTNMGPGLVSPSGVRDDAIYFSAVGVGTPPNNPLCAALDPPILLGTLSAGPIGGTELAAAALAEEGVGTPGFGLALAATATAAIADNRIRLVNSVPLPIADIELGPAVATAGGTRWEVLLRNAGEEFHRVSFGLIAPVGTTTADMLWLGCESATSPSGARPLVAGERSCTGGAGFGATVNAATSWTVGPEASPSGTQLPNTLYVVAEGNRPSQATLDTLNPLNAGTVIVLGTVELDGHPDLEPALTSDGVNDIDDIFNTGTPVASFEEADFDLADPAQVTLIGSFNPADDVDSDGVQDLADNCPFAPNPSQSNRGSFLDADDESDFLGDACQCGESTDDGAVFGADLDDIRDYLTGKIASPSLAAEIEERCSVVGTSECNMRDLVFLELAIDAADPDVDIRCDAALSPAQ